MTKILVTLTLLFSTLAFAGGPDCKFENSDDTVHAFTPDGNNWTMTYVENGKTLEFAVNSIHWDLEDAGEYSNSFNSVNVENNLVGILSLVSVDQIESAGFFTVVKPDGTMSRRPVTCTEYE